MADKLANSIFVVPHFVAGESPPAEKLNVMAAQMRNLGRILETAVGDIHGESWPYSSLSVTKLALGYGRSPTTGNALMGADERALDIANIARLIGPSSNLNPRTLPGVHSITEQLPYNGHSFSLRYLPVPPINASSVTILETSGRFVNWVASTALIQNSGDWTITPTGELHWYSILDNLASEVPGTVTYNYEERGTGNSYSGATFNVIPDPNQATRGSGCTLSALNMNNRHVVTLPTVIYQQSNWDGTAVQLGADDANTGAQLTLPRVLTDGFFIGEEIPAGFLFLKNFTKNEIYKDAEYFYLSDTTFEIGGVDLSANILAGDIFVTVTVGTDITTSIDDLRVKAQHTHDRSRGDQPVRASDIIGWTQNIWFSDSNALATDANSGITPYPAWASPAETPSETFNVAPQYLHRLGYTANADQGVNRQNMMLGNLRFAWRALGSPTSGSFGVEFGEPSITFGDPPKLYHHPNPASTWGALQIENGYMTGGIKGVPGTPAQTGHTLQLHAWEFMPTWPNQSPYVQSNHSTTLTGIPAGSLVHSIQMTVTPLAGGRTRDFTNQARPEIEVDAITDTATLYYTKPNPGEFITLGAITDPVVRCVVWYRRGV